SRFYKLSTRAVATIVVFGAVACIIVTAVGGAYPEAGHASNVVAPRTGDVWNVGELHTVQWCLQNIDATNSSGQPLLGMLILSYSGGVPDSHVLLGRERVHLTDLFPITDRLANVMVPSVPTRDDYSLYLFCHDNHDASSWSGDFTIFNPDDVAGIDKPRPDDIVVTTAPPISVT
ncbi:uncharacterized protein BXZ73DRAFT_9364, partial [Epithele typhae]|uniref:uncharacterized protein n=1 Tax=Epithele typhae TaxID=378194 RepID=UPI002007AACE